MGIEQEICPVCGEKKSEIFLSTKDYSVSGENFNVKKCKICTLKFTSPIPSETEIIKYYNSENYISHSDTKKGFVNSLYHFVRKITLKNKLALVNRTRKKGYLLDIGCGTGYFLKTCKKNGWRIAGTEPDQRAREQAEKLTGQEIYSNIFQIEELKKFDVITLWHVLEHIHRLNESMIKIKTLLKDDGVVFIAVPNADSGDAKIYNSEWAAYDVPRHLYHFNIESMSMFCQRHEMKIEKIIAMPFDAWYVSMLSEDYKGNKGIKKYFYSFLNGFLTNIKGMTSKKKYSSLIFQLRLK
jgi:2-polyprenyl-3-methyl-5-hydroxy-6-metoxy-1,4-benzoquinol methylase